jgi:hypothetical protein
MTYEEALREIDRICAKEFADPNNDYGDVGDTLERCQTLAREALGLPPAEE